MGVGVVCSDGGGAEVTGVGRVGGGEEVVGGGGAAWLVVG